MPIWLKKHPLSELCPHTAWRQDLKASPLCPGNILVTKPQYNTSVVTIPRNTQQVHHAILYLSRGSTYIYLRIIIFRSGIVSHRSFWKINLIDENVLTVLTGKYPAVQCQSWKTHAWQTVVILLNAHLRNWYVWGYIKYNILTDKWVLRSGIV